MGQFKPMVKMETTEPSVILKLKKGGHVNMKKGGKAEAGHKKMAMGGGAMDMMMGTPALVGRPAVNAPVRAPGKPSMSARRKAMMAKPAITPSGPPMAAPPMKKGGKAMGGDAKEDMKMDKSQDKAMIKKAFKQHDAQEHKGGKGTKLALKKGGDMVCATGGVIKGNGGGYKEGGMAMVEKNGKMVPDFAADGKGKMKKGGMATGGVKMGNGGGYKHGGSMKKMATGGVAKGQGGYATGGMIPSESTSGTPATTIVDTAKPDNSSATTGGVRYGNAGGFKAGGKSSKKAYAAGGTVNSGRPVAMPEGRKSVPSPVRINQLAGTYKTGGRATPAELRLLKNNAAKNATAMRQSKTDSNMKYGSPKRMAGGGSTSDREKYMVKDPKAVSDKASRELEDALNPLGMVKELYGKAKDYFMPKGADSVTKTKESVTVSPGKKRGGRAC